MQYELPASQTIIKRLFIADTVEADNFAVIVSGETVATVGYDAARRFWLGRIDLAELVTGE